MSSPSLDLYWNPTREDNFVTATAQGRADAAAAGYAFVRREAYLFPANGPGMRELKLYWNPEREDNMTAATPEAEQDAIASGYQAVRVEGYVKSDPAPDAVPLKLYFGSQRGDYFLTGTPEGEAAAQAANYQFVRIEGYGAGPDVVESDAGAIRAYIDGLPPLPVIAPQPGTFGPIVGAPAGTDGQQVSGGQVVNRSAELALLRSYPDVIWPGALVAGATIASSEFAPISLKRASGTIRIATEFVAQPGGSPSAQSQFRHLTEVTAQAVDDARRQILTSLNPSDSAGFVDYTSTYATSLREAMVKLGFAYDAGANSASVNASLKTSNEENHYFVKFFQIFYRAVFEPDPSGPSPFFAGEVTLDQVKAVAGPGNPPLYVSEVAYGRILMLQFTGKMSVLDLELIAKVGINKVSASADIRFKEKVNRVNVRAWSVGGTGALAAATIVEVGQDSVAAVRNYVTGGAKFTLANPGAPVMFTMRYLGRGPNGVRAEPAIAQMITTEGPRILNYEIVRDFQVWRGQPGGGWKDTGLNVMAGDEVRISAQGSTKTWRAFDGPVPPTGWPQPIPGVLDNNFPLGNRPPHSFIARFGDNDNTGIDQTGGPRTAHISSGGDPSDSFYVGNSRVIYAGAHAAGDPDDPLNPPRVYGNTGRLWLGINDSEAATHGDPSYRLNVRIHIKRV